ncbi:MAG TPA: hypothetical protein VKY15_07155, partial [Acidimicrobiales bacterium]|nr:hypothetical protein [Acidimicrobiales bacterium]
MIGRVGIRLREAAIGFRGGWRPWAGAGSVLWLLAACGGPSAPPQSWSGLSSGVVTVSQPVSPPFGGPRSATYSTPEAVAGLRSAL